MITKFKRNKKRSLQSLFFSIFLGMVLTVGAGFLISSILTMNQNKAELKQRVENLKQKSRVLEEENQKLRMAMGEVSESEYIEKEALERLNLKPKGSEVVAFIKQKEEVATSSQQGVLEEFLEKLKFWED